MSPKGEKTRRRVDDGRPKGTRNMNRKVLYVEVTLDEHAAIFAMKGRTSGPDFLRRCVNAYAIDQGLEPPLLEHEDPLGKEQIA